MIQHIKLRKMTEDEYINWKEWSLTNYKKELIETGRYSEDEAQPQAEKDFSMLTDGLATPGNYLFIAENDNGASVGIIWYIVQDADRIFIADFVVYGEYRRMGYGSAILTELEYRLRPEGFSIIVLHVFEHNKAAVELYKKCGYKIVQNNGDGGMYMEKQF